MAALVGAVIYLRRLPSIVVSLGMSFVWAGLAVLMLPAPGGDAPGWLRALMTAKPPLVPMAIVASLIIAGLAHLIVMRTSFGVALRAVGGNERSVGRAGWSVVGLRAGQVIELNRGPGEPVELSVNGKVVARGELVEVEGQLGVRILSLAG